MATLKDGMSAGGARSETTAIVSELAKGLPNPPRVSTDVIPLQEKIGKASTRSPASGVSYTAAPLKTVHWERIECDSPKSHRNSKLVTGTPF